MLFNPAPSPSSASVTSTFQPRASAQRVYMRESISVQSCASVPPAPALMLKMQLLLSCGPVRKTFSSSDSSSLKYFARSVSSSFWILVWHADGSASPNSTMTWKSSSCFSALSSGSILLRRELDSSMTFWACSRLFQNVSPAIRAFSSPRRFCAPGTSKKPPQVRQFLRRCRNFRRDGVKHSRGKLQESGAGIQWGVRGRDEGTHPDTAPERRSPDRQVHKEPFIDVPIWRSALRCRRLRGQCQDAPERGGRISKLEQPQPRSGDGR